MSKVRRRDALMRSLESPHSESLELAQLGMAEWVDDLSSNDIETLINEAYGKPVQWVAGAGWAEKSP